MPKSKKPLPSFDVHDKVKWIGKDYMSGVVTEVQDQTVTVKFNFGTSKVKKISLEKIDA